MKHSERWKKAGEDRKRCRKCGGKAAPGLTHCFKCSQELTRYVVKRFKKG